MENNEMPRVTSRRGLDIQKFALRRNSFSLHAIFEISGYYGHEYEY
jgi:hypothetical protein